MRGIALLLAACAPGSAHNVDVALAYGRLAPLPASAEEVCVETMGNMFARTFWLRFRVADADAEAFLAASPTLIPLDGARRERALNDLSGALGEVPTPCAPPLLDAPALRAYEAPWTEESTYGIVVWDEQNDVIYVETHHS